MSTINSSNRIVFFSSLPHEIEYYTTLKKQQNVDGSFLFFEQKLSEETVVHAKQCKIVCCFVHDKLDQSILFHLYQQGVQLICLRSAGFDHIDLTAAQHYGLSVCHINDYSTTAIAEHTLALILSLCRHTHRAYLRSQQHDFRLNGLLGMELSGKTVGIIGTGKIGIKVAQLLQQIGCNIIAYDPHIPQVITENGIHYCDQSTLFANADIISLHCPLNTTTRHIINTASVNQCKTGVMLINTSRGDCLDNCAVIKALDSGKIGYLGLDVYSGEAHYFYRDCSNEVITDNILTRLLAYPNVMITGHQAFYTKTAIKAIAQQTMQNITRFLNNQPLHDKLV